MAIPRRISFLEESRSRGMTNLHSSGIEEYEIYSSGSSGNFEEWFIPKILKIPPKIQKKTFKKNFQHWIYISKFGMFDNDTIKWLVFLKNTNKNRKILTNCKKISNIFIFYMLKKEIQYFRGPRQILARTRGAEEW